MCSMTSTMVARSGIRRDPHAPAYLMPIATACLLMSCKSGDSSAEEGSEGYRARSLGLLEPTWVVSSRNDVSKQHSSCGPCWRSGCAAEWPEEVLQSRMSCREPLATGLCCALPRLCCTQAFQPAPRLVSQVLVVVHSGQRLQMDILQVSESLSPQK